MRLKNDAYYTPDDVAARCVATLPQAMWSVWEPHVGGGAFVRAVRKHDPQATIMGSDIDPGAPGMALVDLQLVGDAMQHAPRVAWIVGNPPYSEAEEHVTHAIETSTVGAAFLLRLAFLESKGRYAFWRRHPPWIVHVLSTRPAFTGGKTDSAAYGWFVWLKGQQTQSRLGWLP
jgi:hypothetical protein